MSDTETRAAPTYETAIARKKIVCVVLAALVVFSFLLDLSIGPAKLPLAEVIKAIVLPAAVERQTLVVVRVIRLPIALMALVVGASLALAGMEMQTILNNPLASPYTLGVSSAASFGAALSLAVGTFSLPKILQNVSTPLYAFAFALGSSLFIYAVGKVKRDRNTIILTGIAVNFLFTAFNSILQYFVSDQVLRGLTNWSQGNIMGATLPKALIVLSVALATAPFLLRESWKLTALCLGDGAAASLGVRVDRLRTKVLVLTAVITSVAVCFVGTIGFVGLVAPYVAKALAGEEQRFAIPATALSGALMLSISSILGKSVIPNGQVPLGIVTSMIGIPFLVALVLGGDKGAKS